MWEQVQQKLHQGFLFFLSLSKGITVYFLEHLKMRSHDEISDKLWGKGIYYNLRRIIMFNRGFHISLHNVYSWSYSLHPTVAGELFKYRNSGWNQVFVMLIKIAHYV